MARFYSRITVIGDGGRETLFKKRRKKKVSRWLRPLERAHNRQLKAGDTLGSDLLRRHRKARRKRRDKWLRDGPSNALKATRKALKKL